MKRNNTHRNANHWFLGVLLGLLACQLPAGAFYNPHTGRWLTRDPEGEKDGPNLQAFVVNGPLNAIDALGMQKGAEWLMVLCTSANPCEEYMRAQLQQNPGWDVAGGVVCCGGKKFPCSWAAAKESNVRARAIVERCIVEHERTHFDDIRCPCSSGVTRPGTFKTGWRYYWEEMTGTAASLACFENALTECGDDAECATSIQGWITSDRGQYQYYRSKYWELRGIHPPASQD
jgi:hypothetical protein